MEIVLEQRAAGVEAAGLVSAVIDVDEARIGRSQPFRFEHAFGHAYAPDFLLQERVEFGVLQGELAVEEAQGHTQDEQGPLACGTGQGGVALVFDFHRLEVAGEEAEHLGHLSRAVNLELPYGFLVQHVVGVEKRVGCDEQGQVA